MNLWSIKIAFTSCTAAFRYICTNLVLILRSLNLYRFNSASLNCFVPSGFFRSSSRQWCLVSHVKFLQDFISQNLISYQCTIGQRTMPSSVLATYACREVTFNLVSCNAQFPRKLRYCVCFAFVFGDAIVALIIALVSGLEGLAQCRTRICTSKRHCSYHDCRYSATP